MRRHLAAGALAAFSAMAGSASGVARAEDGPPPLAAPVLSAPVAEPSNGSLSPPLTSPAPSSRVPENRSLLVIPGLNAPRSGIRPRRESNSSPTLLGPAGMASSAPRDAGPQRPPSGDALPPPILLETVPESPADEPPDDDRPRSPGSPGTPSSRPRLREPAPRRGQGFLGRVFPAMPPFRGGPNSRDGITVEPRTDPASDALVKRRIERQIQDNLGSRLRSAEVRVVGKQITIRARAARFWQKRAVRNGLETLPGMNGYKLIVELLD